MVNSKHGHFTLRKNSLLGVNEPCKSGMLCDLMTSIKEFGCVSRHKSKTDFAFFCSNEIQSKKSGLLIPKRFILDKIWNRILSMWLACVAGVRKGRGRELGGRAQISPSLLTPATQASIWFVFWSVKESTVKKMRPPWYFVSFAVTNPKKLRRSCNNWLNNLKFFQKGSDAHALIFLLFKALAFYSEWGTVYSGHLFKMWHI